MTDKHSPLKNSPKACFLSYLKNIDPHDIKFDEHDPYAVTDRQKENAAALIVALHWIPPIVVDTENTALIGREFAEAAQLMGFEVVQVLCAEKLSAEQKKLLRLGYKKILGQGILDSNLVAKDLSELLDMGYDLKATGYEIPEADLIILNSQVQMTEEIEDDVPALDKATEAISKLDDVWRLGNHFLICGSALNPGSYQHLPENKALAAITDPPYFVPVNGHIRVSNKKKHREFVQGSEKMSRIEKIEFLEGFLRNYTNSLVDGALLYVFMDWRGLYELLVAGENVNLTLVNICVWNKNNGAMGSHYRSKHELVCVFKLGKLGHLNNIQLGKFGRYRTNVWDYAGANAFGKDRQESLDLHPTVKPVAMIADAILDCTKPNSYVLDSFAGSGTIFIACEKVKRRAYGIELDPLYVDVAIRRWQKYTGLEATEIHTNETFAHRERVHRKNAMEVYDE